jgi:hypothetical protein
MLLIFSMIFYFYLRILRSSKDQTIQTLFAVCFILTGLVEAIWGLRQLYGFTGSQHYLYKITGSFFNPGPYSGWLAMVFPMALGYAIFNLKGINHKEHKVSQSFFDRLSNLSVKITGILTVLCTLLVLPAA